MIKRKLRGDARFAAAFATLVCVWALARLLVCGWALALAALGLGVPLSEHATAPACTAIVTTDAQR